MSIEFGNQLGALFAEAYALLRAHLHARVLEARRQGLDVSLAELRDAGDEALPGKVDLSERLRAEIIEKAATWAFEKGFEWNMGDIKPDLDAEVREARLVAFGTTDPIYNEFMSMVVHMNVAEQPGAQVPKCGQRAQSGGGFAKTRYAIDPKAVTCKRCMAALGLHKPAPAQRRTSSEVAKQKHEQYLGYVCKAAASGDVNVRTVLTATETLLAMSESERALGRENLESAVRSAKLVEPPSWRPVKLRDDLVHLALKAIEHLCIISAGSGSKRAHIADQAMVINNEALQLVEESRRAARA